MTTFVGQNYGAGKLDRVKRGIYVVLGLSFLITAILSVTLYLAGAARYLSRVTADAAGNTKGGKSSFPGSGLRHLCVYRGSFRRAERHRGLLDSHDYDGSRSVRPESPRDPCGGSAEAGHPYCGVQLSAYLEYYKYFIPGVFRTSSVLEEIQ